MNTNDLYNSFVYADEGMIAKSEKKKNPVRWIAVAAACLVLFAAVFSGVKLWSDNHQKHGYNLSYEALMAFPRNETPSGDNIIFSNGLKECIEWYHEKGIDNAIATGQVSNIRWYIIWDNEDGTLENVHASGFSICDITITNALDEYNTLGIKVGDKKTVLRTNYLTFSEENEIMGFLAEKTGKSISSIEELLTVESGVFELIPEEGKEYTHYIENTAGGCLPLEEGRSYSFMIHSGRYVEGLNYEVFSCQWVSPSDNGIDLETIIERYCLKHWDSYDIEMCSEVRKLFE